MMQAEKKAVEMGQVKSVFWSSAWSHCSATQVIWRNLLLKVHVKHRETDKYYYDLPHCFQKNKELQLLEVLCFVASNNFIISSKATAWLVIRLGWRFSTLFLSSSKLERLTWRAAWMLMVREVFNQYQLLISLLAMKAFKSLSHWGLKAATLRTLRCIFTFLRRFSLLFSGGNVRCLNSTFLLYNHKKLSLLQNNSCTMNEHVRNQNCDIKTTTKIFFSNEYAIFCVYLYNLEVKCRCSQSTRQSCVIPLSNVLTQTTAD